MDNSNPVREAESNSEEREELTYTDGYISACEEWEEHRFDIKEALYGFAIDPADSEFQEGFRDALLSKERYGVFLHTPQDSNVTYVLWRERQNGN